MFSHFRERTCVLFAFDEVRRFESALSDFSFRRGPYVFNLRYTWGFQCDLLKLVVSQESMESLFRHWALDSLWSGLENSWNRKLVIVILQLSFIRSNVKTFLISGEQGAALDFSTFRNFCSLRGLMWLDLTISRVILDVYFSRRVELWEVLW